MIIEPNLGQIKPMKYILYSIAIFTSVCCHSQNQEFQSSEELKLSLMSNDSIDIWTYQVLWYYNDGDSTLGQGRSLYGEAIIITIDSLYSLSGYNKSALYSVEPCSINNDTLPVDNKQKTIVIEENTLNLLFVDIKPRIAYDTLAHIFVKTYLRRRVPTDELRTYFENRALKNEGNYFLGLQLIYWVIPDGIKEYKPKIGGFSNG